MGYLNGYFLEAIHVPGQFDQDMGRLTGTRPSELIQSFYDHWIQPLLGTAGLAPNYDFHVSWEQSEDTWYGPFGVVLFLAMAWALVAGTTFLRLVAMVLFSFYGIVCWKIGWMPYNEDFLAVFFIGGIIALAPLLDNSSRLLYRFLAFFSIVSLTQAAAYNLTKPLLAYELLRVDNVIRDSILNGNNVWAETAWGKENYWQNHVDGLRKILPAEGKVALVAGASVRLFPLMVGKPGLIVEGITCPRGNKDTNSDSNPFARGRSLDLHGYDYFLAMQIKHDVSQEGAVSSIQLDGNLVHLVGEEMSFQKIWEHSPGGSSRPSALYKVLDH